MVSQLWFKLFLEILFNFLLREKFEFLEFFELCFGQGREFRNVWGHLKNGDSLQFVTKTIQIKNSKSKCSEKSKFSKVEKNLENQPGPRKDWPSNI